MSPTEVEVKRLTASINSADPSGSVLLSLVKALALTGFTNVWSADQRDEQFAVFLQIVDRSGKFNNGHKTDHDLERYFRLYLDFLFEQEAFRYGG
jgi:hypothetical protein